MPLLCSEFCNCFLAQPDSQCLHSGSEGLMQWYTQIFSLASFPTAFIQGTVAFLAFFQHASHNLPEGPYNCCPKKHTRCLLGPCPQFFQIFVPKLPSQEHLPTFPVCLIYVCIRPLHTSNPSAQFCFLPLFFVFFSCYLLSLH